MKNIVILKTTALQYISIKKWEKSIITRLGPTIFLILTNPTYQEENTSRQTFRYKFIITSFTSKLHRKNSIPILLFTLFKLILTKQSPTGWQLFVHLNLLQRVLHDHIYTLRRHPSKKPVEEYLDRLLFISSYVDSDSPPLIINRQIYRIVL